MKKQNSSSTAILLIYVQPEYLKMLDYSKALEAQNDVLNFAKQEGLHVLVLEYENSGETITGLKSFLGTASNLKYYSIEYNNKGYKEFEQDTNNIKNFYIMGAYTQNAVLGIAQKLKKNNSQIITSKDVLINNPDQKAKKAQKWLKNNTFYYRNHLSAIQYIKKNLVH